MGILLDSGDTSSQSEQANSEGSKPAGTDGSIQRDEADSAGYKSSCCSTLD